MFLRTDQPLYFHLKLREEWLDAFRFPTAPQSVNRGVNPSTYGGTIPQLLRRTPNAPLPPSISAPGLDIRNWAGFDGRLTLNDKPLELSQGERSNSLAIARDGQSFLLGTTSRLILIDRTGREKWSVPSVIGGVGAVNITENGKLAVAAIADGTIRWYRMTDGKELLIFFPHVDQKRWVFFAPNGYYDASPGGEDLVGWSVNRGITEAGDFFPVSRFRKTFYKPELIAQVLETGDLPSATMIAGAESTRPPAPLTALIAETSTSAPGCCTRRASSKCHLTTCRCCGGSNPTSACRGNRTVGSDKGTTVEATYTPHSGTCAVHCRSYGTTCSHCHSFSTYASACY